MEYEKGEDERGAMVAGQVKNKLLELKQRRSMQKYVLYCGTMI